MSTRFGVIVDAVVLARLKKHIRKGENSRMNQEWNGIERRSPNNTLTNYTNPVDTLTPREREVLNYLSRGEHSKTIAHDLQISPETLRTHRKNILKKLASRTTIEAIVKLQDTTPSGVTNIYNFESTV